MLSAPSALYRRHRYPAEIITHAVWLCFRFNLSFRDVEELLAERGVAYARRSLAAQRTEASATLTSRGAVLQPDSTELIVLRHPLARDLLLDGGRGICMLTYW